MKKKYFCVSDIHSFYTILIQELEAKSFDINNKNHILVVLGDAFDRGSEGLELLNFLYKLLDANRLIYIKGNHDDLLRDLCVSKSIHKADITNGTVQTVLSFSEANDIQYVNQLYCRLDVFNKALDKFDRLWHSMVDYFELKDYIFVHGFMPVTNNWRDKNDYVWKLARWDNAQEVILDKSVRDVINTDKYIVCGHWHCNYTRDKNKKEADKWKDFSIYKDEEHKLIAIDACTALSMQINVLVIEE